MTLILIYSPKCRNDRIMLPFKNAMSTLIILLLCLTAPIQLQSQLQSHGSFSSTQMLDSAALPADYFKQYSVQELCQDLDSAVWRIEHVHPNCYAYTPKVLFRQAVAALRNRIVRPMTRAEFSRLLTPLVARLQCGHTFVRDAADYSFYRDSNGRLCPFDVDIIAGRLFVQRNYAKNLPDETGYTPKAGTEITSINGIPAKHIIATLLANQSFELESPKTSAVARRFRREIFDSFGWGTTFAMVCKEMYKERTSATPKRVVLSGLTNTEYTERKRQTDSLESGLLYSFKKLTTADGTMVGYVDVRGMVPPEDRPRFEAFLKESFATMRRDSASALIVDVRNNAGGDSQSGDVLLDYFADKPWSQFGSTEIYPNAYVKGVYGEEEYRRAYGDEAWSARNDTMLVNRHNELTTPTSDNVVRFRGAISSGGKPANAPPRNIVVLMSPKTFSSAYSFVCAVKAFKLGILVGQEAGGAYGGYGQCFIQPLPNTGVEMWIATKRFFPPAIAGQKAGSALMPDVYVKMKPENMLAGRDAVVERALKEIMRAKQVEIQR
jgi:C-terminal processing protease CtpA/Prc